MSRSASLLALVLLLAACGGSETGTAVDETLVRGLENGVGKVTIDLGNDIVPQDHRVFGGDLSKAEDYIGVNLHGLLGQDLFMEMFFGLDYRAREVTCARLLPPL